MTKPFTSMSTPITRMPYLIKQLLTIISKRIYDLSYDKNETHKAKETYNLALAKSGYNQTLFKSIRNNKEQLKQNIL